MVFLHHFFKINFIVGPLQVQRYKRGAGIGDVIYFLRLMHK